MNLSVVVPIHFEGAQVEKLVQGFCSILNAQDEMIFVYDQAQDPTVGVLQALEKQVPCEIKLIQNLQNPGFRGAVGLGLQTATREWVAVMMGDLSDSPVDLKKMLSKAQSENVDVVVGSRYLLAQQPVENSLKARLSYWASRSLVTSLGCPVSDMTNNFRLYRKSCLQHLVPQRQGGMELAMEMLLLAFKAQLKIVEVAVGWQSREQGESQFQFLRWLPRYLKLYFQTSYFLLTSKVL